MNKPIDPTFPDAAKHKYLQGLWNTKPSEYWPELDRLYRIKDKNAEARRERTKQVWPEAVKLFEGKPAQLRPARPK